MAGIDIHGIIDSDSHFQIDPVTRGMSTVSTKTSLMQYDHNSECFTFEVPKKIEGHDMSLSSKIEIQYTNSNRRNQEDVTRGVYLVTDATVNTGGDSLVFSWLISGNATKFVGPLNFTVCFSCFDETGELVYRWNTGIHTGITIAESMNNDNAVVEKYVDVLEQWRRELLNLNPQIPVKLSDLENDLYYSRPAPFLELTVADMIPSQLSGEGYLAYTYTGTPDPTWFVSFDSLYVMSLTATMPDGSTQTFIAGSNDFTKGQTLDGTEWRKIYAGPVVLLAGLKNPEAAFNPPHGDAVSFNGFYIYWQMPTNVTDSGWQNFKITIQRHENKKIPTDCLELPKTATTT